MLIEAVAVDYLINMIKSNLDVCKLFSGPVADIHCCYEFIFKPFYTYTYVLYVGNLMCGYLYIIDCNIYVYVKFDKQVITGNTDEPK